MNIQTKLIQITNDGDEYTAFMDFMDEKFEGYGDSEDAAIADLCLSIAEAAQPDDDIEKEEMSD